MTRGNFFKSLITLIVAPKVLGEINFEKLASNNVASMVGGSTGNLISDLQLLTPHYYQQLVSKYGNENFTEWLDSFMGIRESE